MTDKIKIQSNQSMPEKWTKFKFNWNAKIIFEANFRKDQNFQTKKVFQKSTENFSSD